ncbi:hypothetical protein LP419_23710 [Massilia sp. H-1]|nr:hypothetical protein LP419_23710 [Massilia sp. H-1]
MALRLLPQSPSAAARCLSTQDWESVMALLRRRVGLIDAVVFSGGEPTIDPCLAQAIADVRCWASRPVCTPCLSIYPEHLGKVLPLLDWVGFDIKAPAGHYARDRRGRKREGGLCLRQAGDRQRRRPRMPHDLAFGAADGCAVARTGRHPVRHGGAQLCPAAVSANRLRRQPSLSLARSSAPATATLDAIGALFPAFTLRRSD